MPGMISCPMISYGGSYSVDDAHMELTVPSWLRRRSLPAGISLQVFSRSDDLETIVFESSGKWLYPLLELEQFIALKALDPASLVLHDQVAGQAAAALAVRLGFKLVKARMMSSLACPWYDRHRVAYCYDTLVPHIACMTEQLVDDSMGLEQVHDLIVARVKKNRTANHC